MKDKIIPSELLETLKRLERPKEIKETKIIAAKNPRHSYKVVKIGDSSFMWIAT